MRKTIFNENLHNLIYRDRCKEKCDDEEPIYILATGQSNVNGESIEGGDLTINNRVKAWNGKKWVIMQQGVLPMGMFFPYEKSTRPLSNNATWQFAKRIQEETDRDVRVVLLGWGGNQIAEWLGVDSNNYSFIIQEMAKIGNPKIDYFIWHQGESNENTVLTTYVADFNTVISQFRSEPFFSPNTPIIVAGVVQDTFPKINEVLRSFGAGIDPFIYFASSDGLISELDGIHFTGDSLTILGKERFFDALRNTRYKGQIIDLTTDERNVISVSLPTIWPISIVRDTDENILYQWDGTNWIAL